MATFKKAQQLVPDNFKPPAISHHTEILPGFKLSLSLMLFYISAIVIIPLIALILKPWENGWGEFISTLTDKRVILALRLSFLTALTAAGVNVLAGVIIAWTLVRYEFFGKKILDAFVELPFALPTAVAGISLSALYAPNGWVGSLVSPLGIKIAYTPIGIFLALLFIGLPFIVRSVQPVLAELESDLEEVAQTLGANQWQIVTKVILPALWPSILTGFSLALARGVGEYGSVIFIAGNLPYISEIAPLLIVVKLEEYDYAGAASVALAMLAISFSILFLLNLAQGFLSRRGAR